MQKIYVLIGIRGNWEEKESDILYIGSDKEKAFNGELDSMYHTFQIEIWINGERIEQHIKHGQNDENGWEKTYDKLFQLQDQIGNLKSLLIENEDKLKFLKENCREA